MGRHRYFLAKETKKKQNKKSKTFFQIKLWNFLYGFKQVFCFNVNMEQAKPIICNTWLPTLQTCKYEFQKIKKNKKTKSNNAAFFICSLLLYFIMVGDQLLQWFCIVLHPEFDTNSLYCEQPTFQIYWLVVYLTIDRYFINVASYRTSCGFILNVCCIATEILFRRPTAGSSSSSQWQDMRIPHLGLQPWCLCCIYFSSYVRRYW